MLDSHEQFTPRLLLDLAPKCADIQAFQDEHSHLIIGANSPDAQQRRLELFRSTLDRLDTESVARRTEGIYVPTLFNGYCTTHIGSVLEEMGDFQLAQGHLFNGVHILDRRLGAEHPVVASLVRHVMMHYL